ncbi:MAG TPA: NADH-quinone oxidoreductase subunit C, partial [Methanocorpusculum sp.]|nr:NADH-quinone oxidoreductase subunit C [Methanocorpusculum sp.]
MTILSPEEIISTLQKKLGKSFLDSRVQIRTEGVKKRENRNIWITIDKSAVHQAAEALMSISYPHLCCISGYDKGRDDENLRVQYIFTIYGGEAGAETVVVFSLDVPKSNPVLPTITDLMEGTAFTEEEKTEYLGIRIEGLGNAPHKFFLPQDFPEGLYPLRKDDKGIPASMVKNLWACGRPANRPPPPLPEKEEPAVSEEKAGNA